MARYEVVGERNVTLDDADAGQVYRPTSSARAFARRAPHDADDEDCHMHQGPLSLSIDPILSGDEPLTLKTLFFDSRWSRAQRRLSIGASVVVPTVTRSTPLQGACCSWW